MFESDDTGSEIFTDSEEEKADYRKVTYINPSETAPVLDNRRVMTRSKKDLTTSFVFEDESMAEGITEEEFEEEVMKTSQKESKLNLLESRSDDTEFDEDTINNAMIFKKGAKEYYCCIGSCVFVFILSSLLWVILFGILTKRNKEVADIVYEIPTLEQYHNLYHDFYMAFGMNYDKFFDTDHILNKGLNQKYIEFNRTV